jgi:hypothetical protein
MYKRDARIPPFGGNVAKKARGCCPAIPDQRSASMATPDTLRLLMIL